MKCYRFTKLPYELADPLKVEEYKGFKLILINQKYDRKSQELLTVYYDDLPVADFYFDDLVSKVYAEARSWIDENLQDHTPEYLVAAEEIKNLASRRNTDYSEVELEKQVNRVFENASIVGLKQAITELNHEERLLRIKLGLEPSAQHIQSQIDIFLAKYYEDTKAALKTKDLNSESSESLWFISLFLDSWNSTIGRMNKNKKIGG